MALPEDCRRVLEIEVPAEVVREKLQAIAVQFQRHARLPGFRSGKAPLSLVKQRFQEDIRSQLLQELVPEYVVAGAKKRQWEPVGSPSVTDVEYGEDAPLRFKATLEVMPEIALQDYRDLTVAVEEPPVSDEEVEAALRQLQAQSATYVNVEPRPVQDGDFASISVQGVSPGRESAAVELKEVLCEIGGADTVREFTENLRGSQLGEERRFEVAYPPDYRDGRLAGKTIAYRVKILGIKTKQVPDLDDDFARELGEFDSLDTLRQRVRDNLSASRRQQAEAEAKRTLRKKLVALHDFAVPEVLVERQMERRMERLRRHLASQGMNSERIGWDWNKVRASQREEASEEVKSSLILERIAEQEAIPVEDGDVDREIEQLAAAAQQPAAALRARLTSDEGLDRIKSRLRIEKALELVFQNAKGRSLGAGQHKPGIS
jgi:trigger factor